MSQHDIFALGSTLSGCDAVKMLEIIHLSTNCVSEYDFTCLFPSIQKLLPFDYSIALLGSIGCNRFAVVGSVDISLPEDFSRAYAFNDYIHTDALVIQYTKEQKLQYWPNDWVKLGQRHEIVSLCMDTNMKTGFIHGSKPTVLSKNGSLFCFSGPSMTNDKRTAAIFGLLVPHLHLSLSQISRKNQAANKTIALTNREIEVLNWLKQGKSSWDISIILGIAERTVNYHIYNVMQKLEAINRPQAVAVALHLGLIDVN